MSSDMDLTLLLSKGLSVAIIAGSLIKASGPYCMSLLGISLPPAFALTCCRRQRGE